MDMTSSLNVQMPQSNVSAKMAQLQSAANKKQLHESAVKFEAMFMNEMFSHMFEGLKSEGPFSGGHGEEMFRSMMVEEYGKKVAASNTTGISASIEKEMLKMQEAQLNPRGTK